MHSAGEKQRIFCLYANQNDPDATCAPVLGPKLMTSKRIPYMPVSVSKTPARLSFGGGGTDLKAYYARHGGLVISGAIDKYFVSVVSGRADKKLVISSADYDRVEEYDSIDAINTDGVFGLMKAVVETFRPGFGLRMHSTSDIPPGSGLGLSGAATVGTIKAVSSLLGKRLSPAEIAEVASYIEIDQLRRPIGKQDQYASTFGGLNEIEFSSDSVTVSPLSISAQSLRELGRWTMLYFTGKSRDSASILSEQTGKTSRGQEGAIDALHQIKERARQMKAAILDGDYVRLGELVHASWQAKKSIVDTISSSKIDDIYGLARKEGAIGGKICGAGGGGFLMLICAPEKQATVEAALKKVRLDRLRFKFTKRGTHIAS